jgi:hypothetical protein
MGNRLPVELHSLAFVGSTASRSSKKIAVTVVGHPIGFPEDVASSARAAATEGKISTRRHIPGSLNNLQTQPTSEVSKGLEA